MLICLEFGACRGLSCVFVFDCWLLIIWVCECALGTCVGFEFVFVGFI